MKLHEWTIIRPLLFIILLELGSTFYSTLEIKMIRLKWAMLNEMPGISTSIPLTPKNILSSRVKTALPVASFITLTSYLSTKSASASEDQTLNYPLYQAPRPFAYSVEYTSPPSLIPRSTRGEESLLKRLANADFLILGGHIGDTIESVTDTSLQLDLITRMLKYASGRMSSKSKKNTYSSGGRRLAIGLPLPAIPAVREALNNYIQSVTESDLDAADVRLQEFLKSTLSVFNLSKNLPILHLAREKGIELVPLDIELDVLNTVFGAGLAALSDEARLALVPDLDGFVQSVAGDGFKRYTDNVLADGFDKFVAMQNDTSTSTTRIIGSKKSPVTVENYISGRILRDEVMAVQAAKWIAEQDKPSVLVTLLDEAQTKFGFGVQERVARNLARVRQSTNGVELSEATKKDKVSGEILSVLLNPTAADTLSMTAQMRLCLAYGQFLKFQRPLANFLWFSKYPPLKLLIRTKNPINAEGEKPPGESSILKAF